MQYAEEELITNDLDSTYGVSDEELTQRFKEAIRIDDEISRVMKLPTAKYDSKARKAYILYPDGRREYAER